HEPVACDRSGMARSRVIAAAVPAAVAVLLLTASTAGSASPRLVEQLKRSTSAVHALRVKEYSVPTGSGPHDVAPARDGTVWYTAQAAGKLGRLHPAPR